MSPWTVRSPSMHLGFYIYSFIPSSIHPSVHKPIHPFMHIHQDIHPCACVLLNSNKSNINRGNHACISATNTSFGVNGRTPPSKSVLFFFTGCRISTFEKSGEESTPSSLASRLVSEQIILNCSHTWTMPQPAGRFILA